ncbi:hypothetical protein L207DRAFT_566592 [Hyaloscypha variabilis F]|uniref:BTB domain-containing protein n=1 Tax=Hyaloscypha variabilis (strain UAMH 11265 / GT02V1 / F) TaxID=1149755 RepID=A0A2J6RME3_HYAVF|nr:hypothetical protein L207DRAFT_566592 [Hyaloscypha variabilis F]
MASTQTPVAAPSTSSTPLPSTPTITSDALPQNRPERKVSSLKKPAELVTLYAGKSNEKFVVHKEFVTHYSPVLRAAFSSDFIEGQTQTYRLEDTTEEAVRLLIHWIYTQKLDITKFDDWKPAPESPERFAIRKQNDSLANHWVLAEKLFIHQLQNLAIEEIEDIRVCSRSIPLSVCRYVYQNTSAKNPLRRLLVDQCAAYIEADKYERIGADFPQEMLIDLVTVYAKTFPIPQRTHLRPTSGVGLARYKVDEP